LASRVPLYRLVEVLAALPELRDVNRFTVLQPPDHQREGQDCFGIGNGRD
jgi:hypothetical protein